MPGCGRTAPRRRSAADNRPAGRPGAVPGYNPVSSPRPLCHSTACPRGWWRALACQPRGADPCVGKRTPRPPGHGALEGQSSKASATASCGATRRRCHHAGPSAAAAPACRQSRLHRARAPRSAGLGSRRCCAGTPAAPATCRGFPRWGRCGQASRAAKPARVRSLQLGMPPAPRCQAAPGSARMSAKPAEVELGRVAPPRQGSGRAPGRGGTARHPAATLGPAPPASAARKPRLTRPRMPEGLECQGRRTAGGAASDPRGALPVARLVAPLRSRSTKPNRGRC